MLELHSFWDGGSIKHKSALEESSYLSNDQWRRKAWLLSENLKLLKQEETYWYNRCHENWLLKGDLNTSYFHKVTS